MLQRELVLRSPLLHNQLPAFLFFLPLTSKLKYQWIRTILSKHNITKEKRPLSPLNPVLNRVPLIS